MTNIAQTLLTQSALIAFLFCFALVWGIMQAFRVLVFFTRWSVALAKFIWPVIVKPTFGKLSFTLAIAFVLFLWRSQFSDAIQYFEQSYISPVYENSDTSTHAIACFELEAQKHLDEYEFRIFKAETQSIANETGSTLLAYYMVYLSECGMNPFVIRDDGNAAACIQFTRTGLENIQISGVPARLADVKGMCYDRDIKGIMSLTRQYMLKCAKGKPLTRPCDVYACVFAPSFVGMPDNTVLYQGYNNPQYYKNAGLDGYKLVNGKYMRLNSYCDGKITISDLALALEAKKSKLMRSYFKRSFVE